MKITPKEINGWLAPWPISLEKKREWKFEILPLRTVLKWKNPNRLVNLGRISFNEIAKRMHEDNLSGLQDHYIKVLVDEWVPTAKGLVIIAKSGDKDTVVWDGSHRLSALAYALRGKHKIRMTYVGVLTPKKK